MRHTCQWWTTPSDREEPCGKPAVAHISWGFVDGKQVIYWYCAEHYDMRIAFIKECERYDVLKLSGVKVGL